jgi:hypothetical protein
MKNSAGQHGLQAKYNHPVVVITLPCCTATTTKKITGCVKKMIADVVTRPAAGSNCCYGFHNSLQFLHKNVEIFAGQKTYTCSYF